jgi:GDPmannose 4,6-dehydratase
VRPDEIYNLGAMSDVKASFDMPEYTADANGMGALRVLDAVRSSGRADKTRISQASTSELYGMAPESPQRETTPFRPRSPYAIANLYAYWITVNYREAYGMHASNGILFNHESPLRGEEFATRKITRAVSRIVTGLQQNLRMGNLSSKRDWGYAGDYVKAMHLILAQDTPGDYVISTGACASVREFIVMSFAETGVAVEFRGEGLLEKGYIGAIDEELFEQKVGNAHLESFRERIGSAVVGVDPAYFRPADVDMLVGDSSWTRRKLGWEPEYDLARLCREMVDADLDLAKRDVCLNSCGYPVSDRFE